MADITMPQLGETVTEGTITRWAKQVGDRVEEDEILFEVSTDKVDSEVPSPTSGYVTEILVQEGDTVEVGVKLAVIGDAPAGDGAATAAAPVAPEEVAEPEAAEEAPAEPAPVPTAAAPAPAAQRAAPATDGGAGAAETVETGGKVLSPVVRRLIAEHDLDPDRIVGTGAGGRITRADVLALIDTRGGAQAAPAAPSSPAPPTAPTAPPRAAPPAAPPEPARPAPRAPAPAPAPAATAGRRDEVVPWTNIRKRTAEHMIRSQATSAHTLVVIEVDYVGIDKVRATEKDAFRAAEGFGLTYLPFVSRAVIDALRDFPYLNASVGNEELLVHKAVHLGIAVDLDFEGLIVPVVKDADAKRLRAIGREISELAAKARAKKLSADDISGGTFTITNPGPFGTLVTAPIINQPQVAILSTDGVKKRPVVVPLADGTDGIAIHPVGNLAISFDHRANDGAYASAFLARVKEIIETRDWAAELA